MGGERRRILFEWRGGFAPAGREDDGGRFRGGRRILGEEEGRAALDVFAVEYGGLGGPVGFRAVLSQDNAGGNQECKGGLHYSPAFDGAPPARYFTNQSAASVEPTSNATPEYIWK